MKRAVSSISIATNSSDLVEMSPLGMKEGGRVKRVPTSFCFVELVPACVDLAA